MVTLYESWSTDDDYDDDDDPKAWSTKFMARLARSMLYLWMLPRYHGRMFVLSWNALHSTTRILFLMIF